MQTLKSLAYHDIIPLKKNNKKVKGYVEFVGPICESSDKFLLKKNISKIYEGDYVAIANVGAYGMSQASNYNVRPLPAEILVKNSKVQVIKNRQKLSDLI